MVLQLFHLESVLHGFLRVVDGVPTAITQHGRPLSDQLLPQGLSTIQRQSTIHGQSTILVSQPYLSGNNAGNNTKTVNNICQSTILVSQQCRQQYNFTQDVSENSKFTLISLCISSKRMDCTSLFTTGVFLIFFA